MKKESSSVGFVSLSAFLHASVLLGLVMLPAMNLLPNKDSNNGVEFMTDVGTQGTKKPEPVTEVQPEPQAVEPVPEVVKETPKPVAVAKVAKVEIKPAPKKETPKPKVVAVVPAKSKPAKKVTNIEPMREEENGDVVAAQEEAERFAKDQKMHTVKEDIQAESEDSENEVVDKQAETAATAAVVKQQALEKQIETEVQATPQEEPMPAPKTQPAVQKLGDIQESASVDSTGTKSFDTGVAAGPSDEELRSYLDLKQTPGNKPPIYPSIARRNGQQGQVILNYFVTQQGTVKEVKIAKSSGVSELDKEAVRAASQFRYVAGQEGWTSHPVIFSLKGQALPDASRLRISGSSGR